ncbi:hypothetical protein ACQ4PT_049600 [Festuca glaucescens]
MAAATAAASPSSSLLLSRRHGVSPSALRAGASRLRAPRCVLGAEQLRVVEEGKRMGGGDPWAAAWTPKAPAQETRDSRLRIFSGTANRPLAQEIASYLGVDLGKILIKRFADGEIYVQLQESPVILDYLASKTISKDLVVVSPDVGGVVRARAFAKKLSDAPLAIVDKRRQGHNLSEVMHLIGDVKGKVAIMVDDMIDTAGTITSGAALLKQEGAEAVYACCTHAVLSPPAIERLSGGIFEEVIVTNSILLPEDKCFPQLTVLSMANLVAETIWHVHRDGSVSSIFQ